uniref:IKAROS family zinc finger 2 n=1 Tax=Neogobius melanostomus TaxID=47308 RepID=A0A8C6T7Q4_9GOBI
HHMMQVTSLSVGLSPLSGSLFESPGSSHAAGPFPQLHKTSALKQVLYWFSSWNMRTIGVGKPHKCNYCGRSYKQRTSLEEHKERCHSYLQGENMMRYSFPDIGYNMALKYEKQQELLPPHMMEPPISTALPYLGADNLRPLMHHPGPSMVDVVPMVNPLFHRVLPLDSPNISGEEAVDSARSSPQEIQPHAVREPPPSCQSQASPALVLSGERGADASPRGGLGILRMATERPTTNHEGIRVFGREGELRAFQCDHCRVLFLDHVMYTIHMGCHGYRDPLECNICGHRSKDRYEFSSHIVRGEHTFQ